MTENFCCAVLCYEETYSSFGTQNVAISRELEDTYNLGGVKSACKDPSFVQNLIICTLDMATSKMAFFDLNLHVLQVATSNSINWGRSAVQ